LVLLNVFNFIYSICVLGVFCRIYALLIGYENRITVYIKRRIED